MFKQDDWRRACACGLPVMTSSFEEEIPSDLEMRHARAKSALSKPSRFSRPKKSDKPRTLPDKSRDSPKHCRPDESSSGPTPSELSDSWYSEASSTEDNPMPAPCNPPCDSPPPPQSLARTFNSIFPPGREIYVEQPQVALKATQKYELDPSSCQVAGSTSLVPIYFHSEKEWTLERWAKFTGQEYKPEPEPLPNAIPGPNPEDNSPVWIPAPRLTGPNGWDARLRGIWERFIAPLEEPRVQTP
ncbi:hypothetical protein PtB15_1B729 [Puccinia triticina]|nr:hypothetical protein PtB15_1B729 [Puccinia triticina]